MIGPEGGAADQRFGVFGTLADVMLTMGGLSMFSATVGTIWSPGLCGSGWRSSAPSPCTLSRAALGRMGTVRASVG